MSPFVRVMLSTAAAAFIAVPAYAQSAGPSPAYVLRFFEVAPGAQKQGADLLKPLAEASRKEAGAQQFTVLQRTAPGNQFLIFEIWKDQQALDAHMAGAAVKQFVDGVTPLLLAPIDDRPCLATDAAPFEAPGGRTVYAVTHVDVGPPNREKAIDILKGAAATVRKETGNVAFDALQQTQRTNHFEVIEAWKNRKDEDSHETAQDTKNYRATLQPLIGARYDRRWYKSL
jgi:quinol monooxygenase YgiN